MVCSAAILAAEPRARLEADRRPRIRIGAVATVADNTTIPWDWYVDPSVARLEHELIFRRTWQYAGHTGDLSEPGSFVDDAGRRGAGRPRPRPRRRPARVRQRLPPPRLHALRGRRPARDAAVPVPRLDVRPRRLAAERAARRLPSRASTVRGSASSPSRSTPGGRSSSSIPIRRRRRSPSTSATCRGSSPRAASTSTRSSSTSGRRAEYDANWKVCVENYLECYHCAVAHPSFSKAIDVAPGTYTLEEQPTFSSQYGPPKNGGGGVYDADGEVDRGQFHLLFPGDDDQRDAGARQPLDRPDHPDRRRAHVPLPRLLLPAGHRRAVDRRLPRARQPGRRRGPRARRAGSGRDALGPDRRRATSCRSRSG